MNQLPPLPVVVPLLAAALLAGVGEHISERAASLLALAAAGADVVLCAALLAATRTGLVVYWFGGWRPSGGVALGICFSVDAIGAGLALFASVLMAAALIFSVRYFEDEHALFHALMLVFLAGMCGFCLTGDLFNLFVFFELMGAAAFALCGYRAERLGPLQGAVNFAVTNTAAGFLVLCGVALLYARTGALNLAQIGRALGAAAGPPHAAPRGIIVVAFAFLTCGFLTKAAIAPFHFWLADAHAVAPTPVCVLFSGIMVPLGIYAVARLYWTLFAAAFGPLHFAPRALLAGAGVVTALLGGGMCFAQTHLKRLLAFSTISHMGVALLGVALLTPLGLAGAGLYTLGHGFAKGALFIGVGILLHRRGVVDERDLFGRGRDLPVAGVIFLVGGLALAGLPPFGIWAGDAMIVAAARATHLGWLAWITALARVLTAGAVLRAAGHIFLGWGHAPEPSGAGGGGAGGSGKRRGRGPAQAGKNAAPTPDAGERETHGSRRRTPRAMSFPAVALLILAALCGGWPGLRRSLLPAAARFTDSGAYFGRVLFAARAPAAAPLAGPGSVPPAPVGVALLIALAAVVLALIAIFRETLRLGGAARAFARGFLPIRRLHSGVVGDYIAWFTVGITVYAAALAALLR